MEKTLLLSLSLRSRRLADQNLLLRLSLRSSQVVEQILLLSFSFWFSETWLNEMLLNNYAMYHLSRVFIRLNGHLRKQAHNSKCLYLIPTPSMHWNNIYPARFTKYPLIVFPLIFVSFLKHENSETKLWNGGFTAFFLIFKVNKVKTSKKKVNQFFLNTKYSPSGILLNFQKPKKRQQKAWLGVSFGIFRPEKCQQKPWLDEF